jgi:hypothetical protein
MQLETEEMRNERHEKIRSLVKELFAVSLDHLGTDEATRLFAELAKRGHGKRGRTKANLDFELWRLYCAVRGKWSPAGEVDYRVARQLKLDGVRRADSLPQRIGELLCSDEPWPQQVVEIIGCSRPQYFRVTADAVARRIRTMKKRHEDSEVHIVLPPWPPATRTKNSTS